MNQTITLPRAVVEQAQMWIPLLAEMAGMDPETTTAEFSEFADGRPASEFTIANVITALRAALEQPQNHVPDAGNMVPAGWKLVPVEPTMSMQHAALIESRAHGPVSTGECNALPITYELGASAIVYRAMLAAAPQPPVVEQAQVEQEPVAYRHRSFTWGPWEYVSLDDKQRFREGMGQPLYIRPEPQGEQPPVAWALYCADKLRFVGFNRHPLDGYHSDWSFRPLYTHSQPPRQPLTDEQKAAVTRELNRARCLEKRVVGNVELTDRIASAIERAHGIGGEE